MQETVGVSRHPRISRVQLEVAWTLESASAVGSDRGCMRYCPAEGGIEPVGKIPQRGRLEICLACLLLSSKFRLRAIGDPWRRVAEPRGEMPHQGCVKICLTAPASGFSWGSHFRHPIIFRVSQSQPTFHTRRRQSRLSDIPAVPACLGLTSCSKAVTMSWAAGMRMPSRETGQVPLLSSCDLWHPHNARSTA
jgi:hypothetical protein